MRSASSVASGEAIRTASSRYAASYALSPCRRDLDGERRKLAERVRKVGLAQSLSAQRDHERIQDLRWPQRRRHRASLGDSFEDRFGSGIPLTRKNPRQRH